MAKFNAIVTTLVVLVLLGGAIFVLGGHMYMGADVVPSHLEAHFAHKVVDKWIAKMKPPVSSSVPPTDTNIVAGEKIYLSHCAGCHGNKQNPVSKFGRSMYPPAPQFSEHTPDMAANENFVVIKHGTRWTGMPAWKALLTDDQIWQLCDFLTHMANLPPQAQTIWNTGNPDTK